MPYSFLLALLAFAFSSAAFSQDISESAVDIPHVDGPEMMPEGVASDAPLVISEIEERSVDGVAPSDCSSNPGAIIKVSPMYQARWVPEEGASLVLSFLIGDDGLAEDIEVVESGGRKLDKAAKNALKRWFYHPRYAGCSRQERFDFSSDD